MDSPSLLFAPVSSSDDIAALYEAQATMPRASVVGDDAARKKLVQWTFAVSRLHGFSAATAARAVDLADLATPLCEVCPAPAAAPSQQPPAKRRVFGISSSSAGGGDDGVVRKKDKRSWAARFGLGGGNNSSSPPPSPSTPPATSLSASPSKAGGDGPFSPPAPRSVPTRAAALRALVALSISAKREEAGLPNDLSRLQACLVSIGDDGGRDGEAGRPWEGEDFEASAVTAAELEMLELLRWRTSAPTAACFAGAFLDVAFESASSEVGAEASPPSGLSLFSGSPLSGALASSLACIREAAEGAADAVVERALAAGGDLAAAKPSALGAAAALIALRTSFAEATARAFPSSLALLTAAALKAIESVSRFEGDREASSLVERLEGGGTADDKGASATADRAREAAVAAAAAAATAAAVGEAEERQRLSSSAAALAAAAAARERQLQLPSPPAPDKGDVGGRRSASPTCVLEQQKQRAGSNASSEASSPALSVLSTSSSSSGGLSRRVGRGRKAVALAVAAENARIAAAAAAAAKQQQLAPPDVDFCYDSEGGSRARARAKSLRREQLWHLPRQWQQRASDAAPFDDGEDVVMVEASAAPAAW